MLLEIFSHKESWDIRASSFLFKQISVAVRCFNSVLLHDGFIDDDRPEWGSIPNKFCGSL